MVELQDCYSKLKDVVKMKESAEYTSRVEFIKATDALLETMNQKELSSRLGISPGYLSKLKSGERKITIEIIERTLKCVEVQN